MSYKHQKGVIKESAVKALLKDPLFRQRVERNLKGKGSYQRNQKHRNREAAYENGVMSPFLYAA